MIFTQQSVQTVITGVILVVTRRVVFVIVLVRFVLVLVFFVVRVFTHKKITHTATERQRKLVDRTVKVDRPLNKKMMESL